MNARRIIALVLGVAAALSLLAKFGLLRAIGLDDFPFWLIWPLTVAGLAGALMLWFSPADPGAVVPAQPRPMKTLHRRWRPGMPGLPRSKSSWRR